MERMGSRASVELEGLLSKLLCEMVRGLLDVEFEF